MLKKFILIVCGLLTSLALAGFMLPNDFKVVRSIDMQGVSPAQVFKAVNQLENWKHWGVWFKRDPNMKVEYLGEKEGVGSKNKWISVTEGSGEMEIFKSELNQLIQYRLHFPDFDMTSIGTIRIRQTSDGVQVTWSDEGQLGMNPVNRYFGLMLDGMIGPDFEQGLKNLEQYAKTLN
jgi:hypothetical protein